MSSILCPHCGTANRAGSNFCNKCGTALQEAAEETAETPESVPAIRRALSAAADQWFYRSSESEAAALPEETPPNSGLDEALLAEQPWLRSSEVPDPAAADDGPPTAPAGSQPAGRLITGVQGLLTPISIVSDPAELAAAADPMAPLRPALPLDDEQVRQIRRLMSETPLLADTPPTERTRERPRLYLPWVFWLIGLALAMPVLLSLDEPAGTPQRWPGVEEAHRAVETLPSDAYVRIYWAYDPATSGELDLVLLPVLRHLLDRNARLSVVSPLPGGPATARRLIGRALGVGEQGTAWEPIVARYLVQNIYLPGGSAALSLLASDGEAGLALRSLAAEPRAAVDLVLIAAAQAEDAQTWLEVVQPLDATAAIAVTSAAADPWLRPYWDSRQLRGLVSGYDGAAAYVQIEGRPSSADEGRRMNVQMAAQNWGFAAVLFLLLLGNLAALFVPAQMG